MKRLSCGYYERLPAAGLYRCDTYSAYLGWVPPDRRAVGKGGAVNWNEGLHSGWRGKLNRLMRRTKGYSTSVKMLVYSLDLVSWRQGEKLKIDQS